MPKYTKADQTPENLRNIAQHLEAAATALRFGADQMDLGKFEVLEIIKDDQRKRGLECIDAYIAAVSATIRTARESRGDFGTLKDGVNGK